MNSFVQLYIALKAIKKRDNGIIDNLLVEFPDYDENTFKRPLYESKHLAKSLINNTDFDVINVIKNEKEVIDNGFKAEKDSYEFWFRFNDVKLKRRKIFRLGDYYLRLLNNGYGKWCYKFYIKAPIVQGNSIVNEYVAAQHPHISHGIPCTSQWHDTLSASLKAYNLEGLLSKFKLYLAKWSYQSPHHFPEDMEPKVRTAGLKLLPNIFMVDQDAGSEYQWLSVSKLDELGYEGQLNYKHYKYVSARKKLHESEPLPRLMHAYSVDKIQPLNKEVIKGGSFARGHNCSKGAIWGLYNNFEHYCELPEYAQLNENEKFVVCFTFVKTIYDKIATKCLYKGEWTDNMDKFLLKMREEIDMQGSHIFNDASDNYNKRFIFVPSFLEKDKKLKDAIANVRLAIDEGINLLDTVKTTVRIGSSTNKQDFKDFWNVLFTDLRTEYIKAGSKFADYHDMLDYANKIEVDDNPKAVIEVFAEVSANLKDMISKFTYLTNISYANKHKEYLQYIEAHIENYEENNPQEKEEVNENGNNTNNTEESTRESATSAEEVS
jgi:hypothetical protein